MRLGLETVIIAVVILIVAAVVVTIFIGGMGPVNSVAAARTSCINQARWSCETSGTVPAGWESAYVIYGDNPQTCEGLTGKDNKEIKKCCESRNTEGAFTGWEYTC